MPPLERRIKIQCQERGIQTAHRVEAQDEAGFRESGVKRRWFVQIDDR